MWRFLPLLLLVACAPRASLVAAPEGVIQETREIYVTTQREIDPNTGKPSSLRSEIQTLTRYAITLPKDRKPGEVKYPKGRVIDPNRHMLVAEEETLDNPIRALNAALGQGPEKEILLYVHGYNNTYADGILRQAQMVTDFDFNGVAAHYAWPSIGHVLGYAYDRDSVLFARDGLEAMIETLAATQADGIVIAAHSVGAALTMEALRGLAIAGRTDLLNRISAVVLISPDIDVDVFRAQAARIGPLPQPFVIFTSPQDRALLLSASMTGQASRVGNVASADPLADLDVILIDVAALSQGGDDARHLTAVSSPLAIRIIRQLGSIDDAFAADRSARPGLLPGTVIQVRNATRIVLRPQASN